jgi:hypothetical protein
MWRNPGGPDHPKPSRSGGRLLGRATYDEVRLHHDLGRNGPALLEAVDRRVDGVLRLVLGVLAHRRQVDVRKGIVSVSSALKPWGPI